MKSGKILLGLAMLALTAGGLRAQNVFTFGNLNDAIPDGTPVGISDVETVNPDFQQIGGVQVSLNISGNFNGDLYCYLAHDSTLSVLLNRTGRTGDNAYGYADDGFQITLSDTATNGDIHNYESVFNPAAGAPLTGFWQPDGRNVDPATVLDTDPRTAGLGVFDGESAGGTWTLYIADMSTGGTSVLNSWQLTLLPVPEPSVASLLVGGITVGAVAYRRRLGRK